MGTIHYLPSLKSPSAPPPVRLPASERPVSPPARPAINVHQRRFMDVAELAGRLGLGQHARRTIIDRLRGMYLQAGLPDPRNPRFVSKRLMRGAQAIHWGSLWDRGEALAWLEHGDAPPPAAAPIPATRQQHIRATLADRAAASLPKRRRAGA